MLWLSLFRLNRYVDVPDVCVLGVSNLIWGCEWVSPTWPTWRCVLGVSALAM